MQPEIPPPSFLRPRGDIKQFHRGEEVATNIFPLDNTFFVTGLISISCYATRLLEWPYSYSVWRNLPPHLLIRSLGTLYTLLILVGRRVLHINKVFRTLASFNGGGPKATISSTLYAALEKKRALHSSPFTPRKKVLERLLPMILR